DEVKVTKSKSSKCTLPSGQNEPMEEVKVARSIGSKRTALIRSKCTDVLTENTTENTTDIKNPICPVAPQPDDIDPAIRVLSHFNEVTGSSYGKGGRNKTVLGYIRGRLSENYSAEDLMLVVDYLTAKWADDPKMDDYLRPSTLFGPENCVEYFDKAQKWQKRGRPACVKGRWQLGGSADQNFKANFQNVDYSVPANSGFRVSGGTQ
ncbi:conserved phage C-terminal domain-containing protein, partial [Enterobacter roggenkampii]|nr:conserved phage C-terminal domain-containing protein [Enterobacter roggenkampii]